MSFHLFVEVFEDRVEYLLVDVRAAETEKAARDMAGEPGSTRRPIATIYCGIIKKGGDGMKIFSGVRGVQEQQAAERWREVYEAQAKGQADLEVAEYLARIDKKIGLLHGRFFALYPRWSDIHQELQAEWEWLARDLNPVRVVELPANRRYGVRKRVLDECGGNVAIADKALAWVLEG